MVRLSIRPLLSPEKKKVFIVDSSIPHELLIYGDPFVFEDLERVKLKFFIAEWMGRKTINGFLLLWERFFC